VDEFITYMPHDFNPDWVLNGLWGSPLHYFLSESQSRNESVVMLFRSDFGSSGHAMRPGDLLAIESYTRRKLTIYKEQQNQAGKGLFMLQGTKRVANPHRIEHHEGYKAVDALHNSWNYEQRERVVTEPLRLNHYLTRSYSECLQKANDPRLSNMTFSWRKDQGPKLCDLFMEGTELYKPSEHLEDRFLADSMFPKVIHGWFYLALFEQKIRF
jgi:hypothetical protein